MKRSLKLLLLGYFILGVLVVASYAIPEIPMAMRNVQESLKDWATNSPTRVHAFLASFLLSMFGNTTIFLPFPYVLVVFVMASEVGLDPLILGLVSGAGAAVGELTSYAVGRGGGSYLEKHGYAKKFSALQGLLRRHPSLTPLVLFVFAVTPLPDDALLIPLGIIRYGWVRSVVPVFLGKTALLLGVSFSGSFLMQTAFLEQDPLTGILIDVVTIGLVISLVYFVLEYDWTRLLTRRKAASDRAETPATSTLP